MTMLYILLFLVINFIIASRASSVFHRSFSMLVSLSFASCSLSRWNRFISFLVAMIDPTGSAPYSKTRGQSFVSISSRFKTPATTPKRRASSAVIRWLRSNISEALLRPISNGNVYDDPPSAHSPRLEKGV
uniref:Putative secreted protein n=1 Tax=Anopheles triannulatus TaxID=58253 RepID=A0A2M4B508_9DIPT